MLVQPALPPIMDSTMLVTWRACPQKFFLSYCCNFAQGAESVDLLFGGAVAKGLEIARKAYFVEGISARAAETRGINAACAFYGSFEPHFDTAKTWAGLLMTMKEYFLHWPLDQDQARPYGDHAIEFSFAWPIPEALRPDGTPWLYGGRLDMLADIGGKPYVLDEKTTGRSFTHSWADSWSLRNQFMGYTWGAQQAGLPISHAWVRGISVLKTKVAFLSATAYYSPDLLSRWYAQLVRDLNTITRQFADFTARLDPSAFDYNFGDSCTAWGKPCPFSLSCSANSPVEWWSNYSFRHWDPLRQNPYKEAKKEEAVA